ncbi:GNAT family N-acetyltransferase [Aliarcobacter cryaerophilus]|uniref:GNAT family N-acetyltransferase n=1 Tax=Aliarcobacter cryaerophilus TaxID=28198 RepID=UPI003DA24EE8
MIDIQNLDFHNSRFLLNKFQVLEKSFGMDWYDCEDENAKYIWIVEDIENPLGFLSYKIMPHPNKIDFIYIVKIYVLKDYRAENPKLIEEERVSEILFRQIERQGINILTLESACAKLDTHYEKLGFTYNKDLSGIFSSIIGTSEKIMVRIVD